MLKPQFSGQFKRDYKLAIKRGCDPKKLEEVITQFPCFFFNRGLRASAMRTLAKKFRAKMVWGGAVGPTPALQISTSIPSG